MVVYWLLCAKYIVIVWCWPQGLMYPNIGGVFALRAHCALLLDYVPPKQVLNVCPVETMNIIVLLLPLGQRLSTDK